MPKQVDVVRNAWKAGVVLPAFNIPYLPMMEPVIQAVADENSFALISSAQIEWETLESKGPQEVMDEFQRWNQPDFVRLHLDHVCSVNEVDNQANDYYSVIEEAIEIGFPSVMIDGSHEKNLEDNIAVTKRVVDLAHAKGVLVEGEVGQIFGYSDETTPDYDKLLENRMGFTTAEQAQRMVAESGVDWLSVAVGNLHGAMVGAGRYKEKVKSTLDLELIKEISDATDGPLVVHGGSYVDIDCLRVAMKNGVAKMNVAKDIRSRYQAVMQESNDILKAKETVYERVRWLMNEHYQISGISKVITAE